MILNKKNRENSIQDCKQLLERNLKKKSEVKAINLEGIIEKYHMTSIELTLLERISTVKQFGARTHLLKEIKSNLILSKVQKLWEKILTIVFLQFLLELIKTKLAIRIFMTSTLLKIKIYKNIRMPNNTKYILQQTNKLKNLTNNS